MPGLNRLARESVVFDRNYVTQPVCTPSRASIMTGLWPHQSGCLNNPDRVASNTSSIDIVPTVLELLGRKPVSPVSGHSLVPLMSGGAHPEPYVFSQWNTEALGTNARTVISPEGLKLVVHDADRSMLTDRRTDPLETTNLIHDSSRQGDVARLKKELERWMKQERDPLLGKKIP